MPDSLLERKERLSPAKRLILEQRLGGKTPITEPSKFLNFPPRTSPLPLSYAQQRLWFIDQLEGGSTAYNMPEALRLRGRLDKKALEKAINTIVARHESLRTRFAEVEGEPVQVIEPEMQIEVGVEDLRGLEREEQEERVREEMRREGVERFDLERGPLIRMKVLELGEEEHVLLRTLHHIVSDGWSQGVLNREMGMLYEAYVEGRENPLKPLGVQYGDFALWQRRWLEGEGGEGGVLEEGLKYWKEELAGIPEGLELPTDRVRPAVQSYGAEVWQTVLRREQVEGLKKLGQERQATLYMVLLAGLGVLLGRYSGQEDVVVGTPIANRQDEQLEEMIGFFVNTLVMRVRVKGEGRIGELVEEVRRTALKAYEHQDVPFEKLVEELSPERSLNRTPIFQVMLALQNTPQVGARLKGLEVEVMGREERQVRFDLELHAWEEGGEMKLTWLYNRELFEGWRIEQMGVHYERVLGAMVEDGGIAVGEMEILSGEERKKILQEWNDTARELPERTVVEQFEEQVERRPEAVAVVYEGEEMSYRELNERANQLGHYLRGQGVGPEVLVGICMERSLEMVVGLLGILKAGGAYVPLEPGYPIERLTYMMENAQIPVLLVQERLRNNLLLGRARVISIDENWQEIREQSGDNLKVPTTAENLAYVIYTSGSTGQPKGVAVEHRQLVNYIWGVGEELKIKPGDSLALVSTFAADLGNTVLYPSLCFGGKLHVLSATRAGEGAELGEYFAQQQIDYLKITPSHLKGMMEEGGKRALPRKCLVLGGEAWTLEWLRELATECEVMNHYGPTECTVGAIAGRMALDEARKGTQRGNAPLGKPLRNVRVYVLNKWMIPLSLEMKGELYIGGSGVARGYLNRPELAAERFVPDPFSDQPGARMYKTGDLGSWHRDGTVGFLGRGDSQVKIRGYRIELEEIQTQLSKCDGVRNVIVTTREDLPGDKRLVAYYTCNEVEGDQEKARQQSEGMVEPEVLRKYLAARMPDYMIPAAFVKLPFLPLTPNGKVDRKALPAPDYVRAGRYREPRTPQEEILCTLFADVLGLGRRVGIDENFFHLGGHSLIVTRLVSRIRATLGVELAVRRLFEAPSVCQLSSLLQNSGRQRPLLVRQKRPERLPLSYAQQRLWFLDRLEKDGTAYNRFEALRLRGRLDKQALEKAINTIVARHESLRTRFAEVEGEPVQVIEPEMQITVGVEDVRGMEREEQEERVREEIKREGVERFDLERGPLVRMKVLELGEEEHVLLRTLHHIVSDGWSQGVLNREMGMLYEAYVEGRENPLQPLGVQYGDFALWQRRWLEGEGGEGGVLKEGLKYWKEELAGIPEGLELPTDRVRPAVQSYGAEMIQTVLRREQVEGLKKLGQERQATLYMVLLAGLGVLLGRYSGQEDVVVGTPIANRQDEQLEEMIGFFVNTLVMRVRVKGEGRIGELVEEVRRTALKAYEHQDVPFEKLVEELSPERSLNRTPIFQVMLALQNTPQVGAKLKGLEVEVMGREERQVRFDLELHAWEEGGEMKLTWLYNRELFEGWRMEQMAGHYERVLEAMMADKGGMVGEMEILSGDERKKILREWNDTTRELPGGTVVEQFEEQVERRPEVVAVVYEGEELSYRELNERANQLGHYLRGQGVGPEVLVGICMERTPDMVIAVLGALKAGGGCLPLDPVYPSERLAYILEESQAAVVLTEKRWSGNFPKSRVIFISESQTTIAQQTTRNAGPCSVDENAAYVIYTSGSTGHPKGVVVPHRTLANVARWHSISSARPTRTVQFASLNFDVSFQEIFGTLCNGGTLVLIRETLRADIPELGRFLKANRIQRFHLPVIMLQKLADEFQHQPEMLDSLRELMVAGEQLRITSPIRELFGRLANCTLHNHYGPSESHVVTSFSLPSGSHCWPELPPLGRPIMNAELYILDNCGRPVAAGVVGELYIGGICLAQGYLRRPDLTSERFIPDALSGASGARLYKTGDLARYRRDGNIEFLGRSDFQVKIRGFRIELAEIEIALTQVKGVRKCAVLAREDRPGRQQLVAYVVFECGSKPTAEQIRQVLKTKLPEYMVPSVYLELDELPLNRNGKLDRKALPPPDVFRQVAREPRTPEEKILCALFAEVLSAERVGLDDNFFELGGHSLLATRLLSRIRTALKVELTLKTLFEAPTVSDLVWHVSRAKPSAVRRRQPAP